MTPNEIQFYIISNSPFYQALGFKIRKGAVFSVSKAFLKEYPVILIMIPDVRTEEMKLFALHISYSTKLWFIHSFPFFFSPDPQIHADQDPDRAKTCGSGSETLAQSLTFFIHLSCRHFWNDISVKNDVKCHPTPHSSYNISFGLRIFP